MLIGRERETDILRGALKRNTSSFIAVYGRRRVGKTFLVDETFEKKYVFSTTGVYPKRKSDELAQFTASLRDAGMNIPKDEEPVKWIDAFQCLKGVINKSKECKKIVFLDELAWLSAPSSEFLSALGGFWNGWASKRKDIILVVCGSAASWMTDNLIHNKGGLYQRLTDQIHLQPFTLRECEELTQAMHITMDRYAIMEGYMVLGGIPSYWTKLEKGKSIYQNIDAFFGGQNAIFRNELQYLYSSLFENPEPYYDIINALGRQRRSTGMSRMDLITATGAADTGTFSKHLRELEDCGFIRRYRGYGKKEREALYQLIDNFTLFHYKFLDKGITDGAFYSHSLDLPARRAWAGSAFERVCLWHIDQIKKALGINGILTDVTAFAVKADAEKGIAGSQIDLVIERRDRVIDLCEMKFSTEEYVIDKKYDADLRRKRSDFKRATGTRSSVVTVMITPFGLFENGYSANISASLTTDDLFI